MIIFVNEERPYQHWVTHHRQGFVLDGRRKPRLGHVLLHRATCGEVKGSPAKRTHWTTGGRLKACSMDRDELQAWVTEENEAKLDYCPVCHPLDDRPPGAAEDAPISRLGRDVLDYVLESAAIHLEWPDASPYRLTVADIAHCMGKTPAQVSTALHPLQDAGLISVNGHNTARAAFPLSRLVLPTVAALKTLAELANVDEQELQNSLQRLAGEE